ncbi:MAG: carboxypeptidase regulatory-like domain-containing protein [Planctomycetes bacterium]|nr:carboxypeptidase regulatory-like domain-containing protein [Planctomycetota bacterium]
MFLVLVVLTLCAATAAWFARGADCIPMVPLVPAMPLRSGAPGASALPAEGSSGPQTSPGTPVADPGLQRTATPEGAAALRVRVTAQDGTALPGVEVLVTALTSGPGAGAAAVPWQGEQATDAAGAATFAVPCQGRREATVRTSLTPPTTVRLQPGTTLTTDLVVDARAVVRGNVVARDGQPVAGATLCFLPWSAERGTTPQATDGGTVGRSGADGSFWLPLPGPGHLGAHHQDHAPSPCAWIRGSAAGEPPHELAVRLVLLSQGTEVQGTVLDAQGQPIANANVLFASEATAHSRELATPPSRARTDAAGTFQCHRVAPGTRHYWVRAQGFATGSGTITLQPDVPVRLDLVLSREAVVRGTVRFADGRLVQGAAVTATAADGTQTGAARSGADGSFRLEGLPAGDQVLAVDATLAGTAQRAQSAVLLEAGGEHVWNAQLTAGGPELQGRLVDRADQPLAGWTVVCQPRDGGPQGTRTGSDGTFVLRPGSGSAVLLAFAPGTPAGSLPDGLLEVPDPSSAPVHFAVDRARPRRAVTGRVVDGLGLAIAASATLLHRDLQRSVRTSAAADGTLRFASVPAGTVAVLVEHPGHVRWVRAEFAFDGTADLDLGTVVLTASGAMFGSVVGADGQPPASLELFVLTDQGRIDASYSGGSYRLDGVPNGRQRLQVQGPSVAAATFEIDLPAGVEQQRDIVLQRGVRRPFTLEAPAAAGRTLSLALRVPGRDQQWLGEGQRQGDGAVSFTAWLAPGEYEAIAYGQNGFVARVPVVFGEGYDRPVVLRLLQR